VNNNIFSVRIMDVSWTLSLTYVMSSFFFTSWTTLLFWQSKWAYWQDISLIWTWRRQ